MAKRPRKVNDWFDEIDKGLEYRQIYGLEKKWSEIETIFYNRNTRSTDEGINIISAHGESLLAGLTIPRAEFDIRARDPRKVKAARYLEILDNWLIKEMAMEEEVETAVLHAYLWGRGILKIGYDSEFGFDPQRDINPKAPLGLSLTQFSKNGKRRIEYSNNRPGMPWVKAVLPHDIVVPWGTISLESAPWVAYRFIRHIDDLRDDPKYSNTRDLQPNLSMRDFMDSYASVQKLYRTSSNYSSTTFNRGKAEYVECWEIHDKGTGRISVITQGSRKKLRDDLSALAVDGLPFVSLSFVKGARSFWVTSDASYLTRAQHELDDISYQTSKQRRLAVLKFLYHSSAFDEDELDKLLTPEVGAGAAVNDGISLNEAIKTVTASNNNLNLYQDAEYVRRNAREILGFSRNQLGEFENKGRKTAYEVATVDRAAQKRNGRRELLVSRLYRDTFKKVNKLLFSFWRTPRLIPIVGKAGIENWIPITGEALKADYDYDVTLTEVEKPNRTQRQQFAISLYSALMRDPFVDQQKLREILLNSINDPEIAGLFTFETSKDMQQKSAEMQQQLQQAQGSKE